MQQILAEVESWAGFQKIAATLGPKAKGDLFELLTKHYLISTPPTARTFLTFGFLMRSLRSCVPLYSFLNVTKAST